MKVFNIRAKIIEAIKEQCEYGDIIMYAPEGGRYICNTCYGEYGKYILTSDAGVLVIGDNLMSEDLSGIEFENPRFVVIGNVNQSLEEIRENILKCELFKFEDYDEFLGGTGLTVRRAGDNGLDAVMEEVMLLVNEE